MTVQPSKTPLSPLAEKWSNLFADDITLVWGMIAIAWTVILIAASTGQNHFLYYSTFQNQSGSLLLTWFSFLLTWQIMIVAMVLPNSLPLIRLFVTMSRRHDSTTLKLLMFLAAYLTVWMGIAVLAFLAAWGLHQLVNHLPWLYQHPWFIPGITLLIAGAVHFSHWRNRCLIVCRHPYSFLVRHYQQRLEAGWTLGWQHGLNCIGCCWTMMVMMVFIEMDHLVWLLALTGVMLLERTGPRGRMLVAVGGIVLTNLGVGMLHFVFTHG